jgi:hypothetical protein
LYKENAGGKYGFVQRLSPKLISPRGGSCETFQSIIAAVRENARTAGKIEEKTMETTSEAQESTLGGRLCEYRKAKGLTQKAVEGAPEFGVPRKIPVVGNLAAR